MNDRWIYRIENLVPSQYNFKLSLLNGFVTSAFQHKLPNFFYEKLTEEGRFISQNIFPRIDDSFEPYVFVRNAFGYQTCLLNRIKIPRFHGKSPTLNIGVPFEFGKEEYVNYLSHNITNKNQARTLLILWLTWLNRIIPELKK